MSTRLYRVKAKGRDGIEDTVLVDAVTAAAALRFVAAQTFEVDKINATTAARLVRSGAMVYDSTTPEAAKALEEIAKEMESGSEKSASLQGS